MRRRERDCWESFDQSMALYNYIDGGGSDPRKVTEYWHRTFNCIAKCLGFNRVTRRILWHDLVYGNWTHLHQNAEESELGPDEWLDKLKWDVFYASDRPSLDRLTRCHWFYMEAAVDCVGMLDMMEEV